MTRALSFPATVVPATHPPVAAVSRVLLTITALTAIVLVPLTIGTATPAAAVTATGWTATTLPLPTGSTQVYLDAVSCASATDCVAVGEDNNTNVPVAETLSGATWTAAAQPLPMGSTQVNLDAVSCTSATDCVAVGNWECQLELAPPRPPEVAPPEVLSVIS